MKSFHPEGMGGSNPYIKTNVKPPSKTYSITFKPSNQSVNVEPAKIPYGETGLPGSILDIAMAHGIPIDHACGGVCACSTCHVFVKKGAASCNEAEDFELDQLDAAPGNNYESRLACQCVPDGSEDLVIEVPEWNRNLAKEGH